MATGKVIKGDGSTEGTVIGVNGPTSGGPSAPPPPPARARVGVVHAESFEAMQKANAIIEEAKAKAAEIIAQAQQERTQIHRDEKLRGYQQGCKDAADIITRAKMQKGQLLQDTSKDILALALKVAEKIIGADVERDPRVLARICVTAIENLRQAKAVTVRVHPSTGAQLRGTSFFAEYLGKSVDIVLKDDSDVEPTGCVIQTEFGTIDAQLGTQLEMLRNILLPDVGKSEGPA